MAAAAPHVPGGAGVPKTAGHWINKGGKWALIHAVGPGHWVQGPKAGFKAPPRPSVAPAGPHPSGHMPSNPLQPLSNQQIKSQATSMVKSLYAPVVNDLNTQSAQEQAIMDKQTSDNEYYMNWLSNKSTALNVQQQAVNQATDSMEQQLTGNMTTVLGAQPGALTNAANAQPGNVNNNEAAFHSGTPLGNALGATETGSMANENAYAQNTLEQERTAQAALGAQTTNAAAYVEAGQQKQESDFQKAMTSIASAKAADLSKEASSVATEITRLQGQNISLAENNRNYAAAAEKLGLSAANYQSEINARAASTKIRQATLNLNAKKFANTIAEEAIKNSQAQERINQGNQRLGQGQQRINQAAEKLALSVINTRSEVALRNAETYAKTHGALTPHEQNTYFDALDKATGEINNLMTQYGLTGPQAYQAVLSGGFYGHGINSAGNKVVKHISVPRMPNQSMLNAAYNLRQGNSGLTPGDVAYLNRIGLTTPLLRQRYGNRIGALSQQQLINNAARGT